MNRITRGADQRAMKGLHLNRAQRRRARKVVSFLYAGLTVAMITVFVRDWMQSWEVYFSSSARSRQLRSVQADTEVELVPGTIESRSIAEPVEGINLTSGATGQTFQSASSTSIIPTTKQDIPLEHKTTLTTRTSCKQRYFLLILVASAPAYFDRRRTIRQTWASDNSINPRWNTVFLLGKSRDSNHSTQLQLEEALYGDLIRADYYEDYYNQTLKVEMGFEWATKYCSFSFLLKADDDVFINAPAVLELLNKSSTPKEKLYLGFVYKTPKVQRKGKWLLTQEEYNETHYPNFCAGSGYILSRDVVVSFVDIFNTIPKIKIDDAYVGMLANEAGVNAQHDSGFQTAPYLSRKCVLLENTLVRHGAVGQCLLDLFQKATDASFS